MRVLKGFRGFRVFAGMWVQKAIRAVKVLRGMWVLRDRQVPQVLPVRLARKGISVRKVREAFRDP